MNQKLPSDRLKEPRHPWRVAGLVAGLALVAGGGWAITAAVTAPDTSPRNVAAVRLVGGEGKPTTPQISHKLLLTDHVAKSTTPPPPPEPVYVAPPSGGGGGGSNSGALVPFIPSSDPNNAAGGDYLDPGSYCTSGSASGFPPRCD